MGRSDAKSARAILNEIQALVDFFIKKSHEDNQRFKSKLAIKALVVIIQKMMVSELGSRSNRGDLNTLKLNIEKQSEQMAQHALACTELIAEYS